ncbi:tRNA preQ1(34) S-adenosylmethionine ribosyltransferase-isomerase QueA [Fastidiosipila sanguinis]|uniref:S-adenosylmethionine:tRNA ribosyltransferase-isomerase n=1 Tax=Fastidiosipila sanguinis TaxID=236753 RepID=A0A2S0KML7_9FIRM|nr:tRNA preQ1(34) S-adenosylmethionine ribosyltransferase-isomerase QueA [Fastidiosipila sanguinis]AVM42258.1 tRNA preQ1(34) S-adenosylmethionine ribosyltransferase-isomerase QueA [Fastidiosipila sanguinis]
MKKSDFYYDLPEELIAQHPVEHRDESRLLHLNSETNEIEHLHFRDILDQLNRGDTLVLNDSRVIPARLFGTKASLQNPVEVLLLKRLNETDWETIVNPGRRLKTGAHIVFKEDVLEADIIDVLPDGNRVLRFEFTGIWEEVLDELGEMPLPPYIHERLIDKERYQTVYSKVSGSAAAPTAGLHFTEELLEEIRSKGVNIAFLTLHVGLGTFRPVKEDEIEDHLMHTEEYVISSETCDLINKTRHEGNKVIAVGTTSCRVLESLKQDENYNILPEKSSTDIFIYPGYKFKVIDNLITNFHLPESTLVMLVSALAGKDEILNAYKIAVEEKYRFFSFGDAMYIEGNKDNYTGLHQGKVF